MADRKTRPEALHAWLIVVKAWQSMSGYLLPPLAAQGIGESDFRVLEILLHKGPMPVNAIGPKVYLNPGSVSVAVDRLYKKGFVSRIECSEDRRVRTVALSEKGREMFIPVFRRHAALVERAFQDVSSQELQQLEAVLKKVGKHGLRVVQLTSPETEGNGGFSPKPHPHLIASYKLPEHGKAYAISRGLDRDRAVDEAGNQIAVFGRLGARPMNLEEQRKLYLRGGKTWTVSDDPASPLYRKLK